MMGEMMGIGSRLVVAGLTASLALATAGAPAAGLGAAAFEGITSQAGPGLMICGNDPAARALEFWYGDWDVEVAGTAVGFNRIEPVVGGCAVTELWEDVQGGEGRSLFYFLPLESEWRQVWVTPSATSPGGVKEKRMVAADDAPAGSVRFQGTITASDGRSWLDRTTLTPLEGGRVRQHIEISTDAGASWRSTFDAIYIPVVADGGMPAGGD